MPQPIDTAIQNLQSILSRRESQATGNSSLKPSAVFLLLYPKDGEYCVMLNKRTEEVEFNKGDMCFPGGGKDPEDINLAATALRETHEEMGIKPEDVTILGELDETATMAGFFIHPFVGTIPYPYEFSPSSIEVADVVEVPVSHLLDKRNLREETRVLPNGQQTTTLAYATGQHLIYGATARILEQFLGLIRESGWPGGEP